MLEDLKVLLGISTDEKDALLKVLIKRTESLVKSYCKISCIPNELVDTVTDIAIIMYNRIGTEGLSSESYSGVSNHFETDLPKNILRTLRAHRRLF